jgi:hypothetical protein
MQIGLDGSRRELFHAPGGYFLHDIGKSGATLLHHGFERWEVRAKPRDDAEREVTALKSWSLLDVSPDGNNLVMYEDASDSIYICPVRGGEPIFLSHASPSWRVRPTLSPDGKWLLFGPVDSDNAVDLMPTGGGEVRKLPLGKWEGVVGGSFLDAGHVYWDVREPGAPTHRGLIQDLDTRAIQPVTPVGVEPVRSPLVNGAVLGRRQDGTLVWCPLGGGEARPTAARLTSAPFHLQTTQDGRHAFVNAGGIPMQIQRVDLVTGTQENWKTLGPPDLTGVAYMQPLVSMTPDGQAYAYTYLRVFQDLYLVEGLR